MPRSKALVDELHPHVTGSCDLVPKLAATWVYGSHCFSSVHAVFGAHVPLKSGALCPDQVRHVALGMAMPLIDETIDQDPHPLPRAPMLSSLPHCRAAAAMDGIFSDREP